jgi:sporulation protein YlmC with PRC-barrel domain
MKSEPALITKRATVMQLAILELRGYDVYVREGYVGTLDDLLFDTACGQILYLVVAGAAARLESRVIVPIACVRLTLPAGRKIFLNLSRARFESGAGVWPLSAARSWVDRQRICSGQAIAGLRVEAMDDAAGRLADLLVDTLAWCADYLIIDAAFEPLGNQVIVPLDWVASIEMERGAVRLRRPRAALRSAPRF